MEDSETSSSCFFRLEKKRATDRHISALRESDGTIISHIDDLRRHLSLFYSDLFTASFTDPRASELLLSNLVASLAPGQADICEGPLLVDEVFTALCGSDLVMVLNSCYNAGTLALSASWGHLSFL